jgi:hypothetical protein
MDADRVQEAHEKVRGIMKITTNVMTPDGRRIVVAWNHYDPNQPVATRCMVMGNTVDEALRKVINLEEQFEEDE